MRITHIFETLVIEAAIHLVAALTFVSGLVVARLMGQTRPRPTLAHP